jgi:hypothetical protein
MLQSQDARSCCAAASDESARAGAATSSELVVTMSVAESVQRDIDRLPEDLKSSGLAAGVLAMARELDGHNSATSKSMCFKAMQDGLRELRALAPPEQIRDGVDDIRAYRARRDAARIAAAADQPRS